MTATAPDAEPGLPPPGRVQGRVCWSALLALGGLLAGCAEQPLPERAIRRDDCLRELSLATLPQRLQECNKVVAAFPRDPGPLNDRYLLHSLAGNDQAACADLRKAIGLARALPVDKLDPQLRIDLEVRGRLCDGTSGRPAPGAP